MNDKEKLIKLKVYLLNMLNATNGKYKEAIQDTIYFINTLNEVENKND